MIGSSTSTSRSISSTGSSPAPNVYGTWGLTWAMTRGAVRAGWTLAPTETPRLTRPSGPGGLTWTMATSQGNGPSGPHRPGQVRVAGRQHLHGAVDHSRRNAGVACSVTKWNGSPGCSKGGSRLNRYAVTSSKRCQRSRSSTRACSSRMGGVELAPTKIRLPSGMARTASSGEHQRAARPPRSGAR